MGAVNISAKFGKNDAIYNGLGSITEELLEDPSLVRVAVVAYRTKFAKADFENGGTRIPTIRILEFEPLFDEAAVAAKTLQREAFKARTGNPMQPDLWSSDGAEADDPGWDDENESK